VCSYVVLFFSLLWHAPLVTPLAENSLQNGHFWAISIALFRERFFDFGSWCIVYNHITRGRPVGLLQSSGAIKILFIIRFVQHLCTVPKLGYTGTMSRSCFLIHDYPVFLGGTRALGGTAVLFCFEFSLSLLWINCGFCHLLVWSDSLMVECWTSDWEVDGSTLTHCDVEYGPEQATCAHLPLSSSSII